MHPSEHIFKDADTWRRHAATSIADAMRSAIERRGRCTLGLSGGSTPAPVYRTLAQEAIDWSAVTVFLADERCVPATDERSNQHLVRTHLLDSLTVQPTTLFPDTALPPAACADAYDTQLRTLLWERGADVLVLGMGPDGHTASLFPPVRAIDPNRFAIPTQTDVFAVRDRISVTPRILKQAHASFVLLHGKEKVSLWHAMTNASYDPVRWPLHDALQEDHATLIALRR